MLFSFFGKGTDYLLLFQQDDHFQRKVKKDHSGIYILFNMPLGFADLIEDPFNVPFIDKRSESGGKLLLLVVHIDNFRPSEIEDKVLPDHSLAVIQLVFLPFPTHATYLLAP